MNAFTDTLQAQGRAATTSAPQVCTAALCLCGKADIALSCAAVELVTRVCMLSRALQLQLFDLSKLHRNVRSVRQGNEKSQPVAEVLADIEKCLLVTAPIFKHTSRCGARLIVRPLHCYCHDICRLAEVFGRVSFGS